MDREERFWAKVDRSGECWLWTAATHAKGWKAYGQFWNGSRNVLAHRFAYEITHGPIPDGCEIDHTCRTRLCVNPEHLEAVTHAENCKRGQAVNVARDTCKHGHRIEGENEYIHPKTGWRECYTCKRSRDKRRWAS